jgi:hypothetical protein
LNALSEKGVTEMKYLTNEQLVETLRAMADFYEAHPLAPGPMDMQYGWMNCYLPADIAKEVLRSVGSFKKEYEDDFMRAKVKCGHLDLQFSVRREGICERKVVGTRLIPAQTVPAEIIPERFIPEHEEEIVEWDCKEPILADSTKQNTQEVAK